MVGDFAVGNKSLVRRFVYDDFSDFYMTTILINCLLIYATRYMKKCKKFNQWSIHESSINGSENFITAKNPPSSGMSEYFLFIS